MTRSIRFRLALALGTLAAVLAAATPAAAYELRGTGFFARFGPSSNAGWGLVFVDRSGGAHPHLNAAFVALAPHAVQTVVFRSIGCAGTPSTSNKVFAIQGSADAKGDLTYDQALSPTTNFASVKSAWSSAATDHACTPTTGISRVATGDVNGDYALGLVKTGPGTLAFLAERQSTTTARLTIVLNGMDGDDAIRLRVTSTGCGSSAPSSAVILQDTYPDAMKTGTLNITQSQLRSIRALRTRNTTTGVTRCAPAVIMANTEG